MINDHHDLKAMAITSTISLIIHIKLSKTDSGCNMESTKGRPQFGNARTLIQGEFCDS